MEEKAIIRFEDFSSICRLCLKHGELQNFETELYQFYKLCINTYEDETVGLPSNICKSCKFHLENIFTFLGKCKTNESLLHEVYASKVPKQDSTINYQELIKAEVLDSCVLSNGDRVKHQILDPEKYTVSGEFKVLKDQILDPKALEILSQNDPKEQYIQKCDDTLNIQDHNKLLFTCSKCNKIFTTLDLLITHMRQHDNRKPYACSYCDKSFTRSNDLKIHHRIHTGERPFECSYCHKTFKRSYDLKTHTWEHDGRKPHICSYCSKAYSRSYDLKIHLRVHTGERPFKCSSCDKTFKAVNDMNKHKRLHTGERPYVCSYCDKTFTQSSHFKAHVRQHLKE